MNTVRQTGRWRGVVAVALAAGGAGILVARPTLLLVAVVGTAFAAYPALTTPPAPRLEIERDIGTASPRRGETVGVTVTVRNLGERTLPDVRIVDGVPPRLRVHDGTPRHAAALEPGGTTTFEYEVEADYGRHQFEPATIMVRDVSGAIEVETTVADETILDCDDQLPDVPLRQQTRRLAGRIVTDEGGSGTEFHRTREYRHGDPMNRIDWKRHARTGELTTIEFREERAAAVVLLVDAREPAYRARPGPEPHAVAQARSAARGLLATLNELRDAVGLAALGREFCWLPPGAGRRHQLRARRLLGTHPAFATAPPAGDDGDHERQVAELRRQLSSGTQVLVLSPLADTFMTTTALHLEADGHAVTVVSPDVTATETPGGQLATVERMARVHTLREAGVRVVDWSTDAALGTRLLDAGERWSA